MHCPIAGQDLLLSNRMWSNSAKQWLPANGCAHAALFHKDIWVQCALIFLTDFFPTADFDFTCLFNFCTSFFHCIPRHASQQCLYICHSNSCHIIAFATYIIANISKPTRMSTTAHLENYFDKPWPHTDSYSIHNVTEQSEHSPRQSAIDVFHFNPPCS